MPFFVFFFIGVVFIGHLMIQVKQNEEITSARTGALFLSRTVNVSFRLILPFRWFKPLDIKKTKITTPVLNID
jgi:hypothetical protein